MFTSRTDFGAIILPYETPLSSQTARLPRAVCIFTSLSRNFYEPLPELSRPG
jgi:hypothetical protein